MGAVLMNRVIVDGHVRLVLHPFTAREQTVRTWAAALHALMIGGPDITSIEVSHAGWIAVQLVYPEDGSLDIVAERNRLTALARDAVRVAADQVKCPIDQRRLVRLRAEAEQAAEQDVRAHEAAAAEGKSGYIAEQTSITAAELRDLIDYAMRPRDS